MDITVVIPTYNRYKPLQRALNSVYAQTYLPKEVIVVDDGSLDETSQIVKDFPEVHYIYQENSGVSSARNLGVLHGTSDWIAFLDSDDEWHTEKLQEQVLFHKNNANILVSYTDERWIRNGAEVKIPKKFQKIGKDAFLENISYCNIAPSSVVIAKELLFNVGLFDESLEVCEDYDLWLRIASKHEMALVDKKLINKHGGADDQLSYKYWGMDRFRVQSLQKLVGSCEKYHSDIVNHLVSKYELLLKGALKYDKISEIKLYKEKLQYYKQLLKVKN